MLIRKFVLTISLVGFALLVLIPFTRANRQPLPDKTIQAAPLQKSLPEVFFVYSATSVIEPGPGQTKAITIPVGISVPPAENMEVQVEFVTIDGSAIGGVDYERTRGTLTFPAGSTAPQTFDVLISYNNSFETPQRIFAAFLTNSVNAWVSDPAAITVTIVNIDPTPSPTPSPEPLNMKYFSPIILKSSSSCSCPTATAVATGTATPIVATPTGTPPPYLNSQ